MGAALWAGFHARWQPACQGKCRCFRSITFNVHQPPCRHSILHRKLDAAHAQSQILTRRRPCGWRLPPEAAPPPAPAAGAASPRPCPAQRVKCNPWRRRGLPPSCSGPGGGHVCVWCGGCPSASDCLPDPQPEPDSTQPGSILKDCIGCVGARGIFACWGLLRFLPTL